MRRAKPLQNVHPGEVLVEEFLKPLGVTQYQLAKRIAVPMTRIAEICRRRRAISADTALRLARFFGTSSKFWLGLQEDHDLEEELRSRRREIEAIEPLASDPPAAR
jgi:antitoxin HigA-1